MLEPAIRDKRHWWYREDLIMLVLLGALFLLPALHTIPLFDRDEPRFAVAARTMMESGDYIVPRFNGALRPDKPPLVYWLMNLGYYFTGGPGELGARLPSAIFGIGTLIVTYFMAGARFGRLTGFFSAIMLGSTVLFVVEGRLATADSTMLFFIVSCMAIAWNAWDAAVTPEAATAGTGGLLPRSDFLMDRSNDRMILLDQLPAPGAKKVGWGGMLLFWLALAAGTLTKGVPLAFVLVPMIVLSLVTGALPAPLRQWRSHFHFTGTRVGISLAIAAAVVAVFIAGQRVPRMHDLELWAVILGALLVGMILTPGLPGVLVRCLFHGNWKWWRSLRPAVGIPLLIILVGWWVVLAGRATEWKLISDMVGNHFLNRAFGPMFRAIGINLIDTTTGGTQDPMKSYGLPPGFYLLTVWASFWPWSVLIIPATYHTLRRVRGKTPIAIDPRPYQFLLAWIIPMWIGLEIARGKLFHYPLPLYVAMAILCADTLVQSWNRLTDVLAAEWFRAMRWGLLLIWVCLGLGLIVASRFHPDPSMFWRCFPFGVGLIATGAVSAITWSKPSWPYVVVLSWAASLLMADVILLAEMPELRVSRIAGTEMALIRRQEPNIKFGVLGHEEATLVFYAKGNVERFGSVNDLLRKVPFAPLADPATNPYVITIDEGMREELDARGIVYGRVGRTDLPENLRAADTYRIVGVNPANVNLRNFKPVIVSVITNVPPKAATLPVDAQPEMDPPIKTP